MHDELKDNAPVDEQNPAGSGTVSVSGGINLIRLLNGFFLAVLIIAGWGRIDIHLSSILNLSIGGSTRALFYIMFALYALVRLKRRDIRQVRFIRDPLTIFALICFLSTVIANPGDLYLITSTLLPALLGYYVFRYILPQVDFRDVERYMAILVLFGVLIILRGFADVSAHFFDNPTIMSTTSEHHTFVAMITIATLPLCIGLLARQGKKSWLYAAALIIMLIGLIVSNSRIGWFTLLVLLLYLGLSMRVRSVRLALSVFGVAGLLLFFAFFPHLHRRFLTLFNVMADSDFQARLVIWKSSLWMIGHHILLGIGFSVNSFMREGEKYFQVFPYHHPHNILLAVLVYTGIIGSAVFVWIMAKIVTSLSALSRQRESPLEMGIAALRGSFLGLFLMNMVESLFISERATLLFFLLMAYLFFLREYYDHR